MNWLFGVGLIANERYDIGVPVRADNVYLALVLYSGIVGLALIAVVFYRLMRFAIRYALRTKDPLWLAMSAFLFALPVTGCFTVQLNTPALLLVMVWILSPPVERAQLITPLSGIETTGRFNRGKA